MIVESAVSAAGSQGRLVSCVTAVSFKIFWKYLVWLFRAVIKRFPQVGIRAREMWTPKVAQAGYEMSRANKTTIIIKLSLANHTAIGKHRE